MDGGNILKIEKKKKEFLPLFYHFYPYIKVTGSVSVCLSSRISKTSLPIILQLSDKSVAS
jgi:hypothetical protein